MGRYVVRGGDVDADVDADACARAQRISTGYRALG
jgi:hypothetical protein